MADQGEVKVQFGSLGMDLDSSKVAIGTGLFTYVLNGLLTEKGFIQNEPANFECTDFPSGYLPIGHVNLEDSNETVYFLVNSTNNHSEIGKVDQYCNYTQIVNDDCLGFSIEHQIRAVYRPNGDCGRNIYWTDDYNVPRWMDIDNVPQSNLCDEIRIFQFTGYPCIEIDPINYTTGILHSGVYSFTIQYSDFDGNPKSAPFFYTNPYPIVEDNIDINAGGVIADTPTNKAINILFSDLNTNFDYFNIIVMKKIDGILEAQRVITLPTTTTSYLYTGSETATDISIDEAIEDPVSYNKAKEILQTNRRLMLFNLEGRTEFNFQPYANNIQVQWVTRRLDADTLPTPQSYQNPYFTVYSKTLLRDEVYAIGIRLIYADGTKSCVYHIPGRALNTKADGSAFSDANDQYGNAIVGVNWDDYTVNGGMTDPTDDNFDGDADTPRWKIYNTAVVEDDHSCDDTNPLLGEIGQMSYWEEALTYPNDSDIWGALAGQPIRHHKMPDCSVVNIFVERDGTYLQDPLPLILGLKLSNIDVSAVPECIGYEIVIGDRTFHKSIIDKGLLFNNMYHEYQGTDFEPADPVTDFPYLYTNWGFNDPTSHSNYNGTDELSLESNPAGKCTFTGYSPRALFNNVAIGGVSELKIESEFYGIGRVVSSATTVGTQTSEDSGFDFTNVSIKACYATYNLFNTAQYTSVRREVLNKEYVLNNVGQNTALGNFNNIGRESSTIFEVGSDVALCTVTDTSKNFEDDAQDDTEYVCSYYYSIKSPLATIWGPIQDIPYLNSGYCAFDASDTVVDCYFPGDSFITKFAFHKRLVNIFGDSFEYNFDQILNNYTDQDLDDSTSILYCVPIFFCESDVNTEFRYNGNTIKEYYYPDLNNHVVNTQVLFDTGWLQPKNIWIGTDNYYLYNNDYSSLNNFKFACVATAENLSECTNDFPTRAIYSEQQNVKELFDNYLVYKANSLYDYPMEDGEIWQCFASGDTLFVRTLTNIYQHRLNFQELNTDVNNIIVGTGALFAIPPVPMAKIDNGYGGTRDQWALNLTPFGYFFTDSERGTVFQFDQGLNEISQNKAFRWFKDNLTTQLDKQVDAEYGPGTFRNFDNPANPNGIGLLSAWDNKYKRWILTKRDYSIKPGLSLGVVEDIYFDQDEQEFYIPCSGGGNCDCCWDLSDMPTLRRNTDTMYIHSVEQGDAISFTPQDADVTTIQEILDQFFSTGILAYEDASTDGTHLCIHNPLLTYGDIYFIDGDTMEEYYRVSLSCRTPITLDNTDYFCNKSFTISYSPITKHWVSFHSYLPSYYVTGKDTFQSVNGDNVLYSHGDLCNYQTYYGDLKPFIIELTNTLNSFQTFTSPSIIWTQEEETCTNSITTDLVDFTFNKAYVYNENQHSGMLNLSLPDDTNLSTILNVPTDNLSSRTIKYSDRENTYSFSDFEDITKYQDKQVNYNISDCTNADFISAYPIDKVPDTAKLDFLKNWYERTRFRGNWISYRLIQDARGDMKLITNFFITEPKISQR